MAEFVTEMQERLLPEYELLKKYEICTDDQIKELMRKREAFQIKITQSQKFLSDFTDFIIFERKLHKWVTEKESAIGTNLNNLKKSIAGRIIRSYRDALNVFPYEVRLWQNFIKFAKQSVPFEVAGIYQKMLTFHGDKDNIWCSAALWAYEHNLNVEKTKEIFFRALQRHPSSELIYTTFFELLLVEALKKSDEKNLDNDTTSDRDMALEVVKVVYKNSKKQISNISFFLQLLTACEDEKFVDMTAELQKIILDDLMNMYAHVEQLWDVLAQRELRGLNMCDLENALDISKKRRNSTVHNDIGESGNGLEEDQHVEEQKEVDDSESKEEEMDVEAVDKEDMKVHSTSEIWQKRTFKQRIELCYDVYQVAVSTLKTPLMWTLFINAMLKLNHDGDAKGKLKRKFLVIAFKNGHKSGLMSCEHYRLFTHMLHQLENGTELAENILLEALKNNKEVEMYKLLITTYILSGNRTKVLEVLYKANSILGAQSVSIWKLATDFFKSDLNNNMHTIKKLLNDASQQLSPEFGQFRADYLEFCFVNKSLKRARAEYDRLCELPPPCLALHEMMATLESHNVKQSQDDIDRWRLCHERASYYFGKTHTKVWIDFMQFERDHGNLKHLSLLYTRAMSELDPTLRESFISEHTFMMDGSNEQRHRPCS